MMMKQFLKAHCKYQSSAKVVDGSLIISLPDAVTPIVWRMELANVKASALEVQPHDKGFMLMLKTPRGESHDIAPFETKEAAVHALMRVSNALQNASGHMAVSSKPQENTTSAALSQTPHILGRVLKWTVALVGILIVLFLFSYLARLAGPSSQTASINSTSTSEDTSGIPQSADSLLQGF